MTFNSVFKEIYSGFLERYGYQYCSKLGCFAKVLNSELLYVVNYSSRGYAALAKGDKAFTITGTIVSVYYPFIEKSHLKEFTSDLYEYDKNCECNGCMKDKSGHIIGRGVIYGFEYNERNLADVLKGSIYYVEKYMIPVMEGVTDFDSYIEFLKDMDLEKLRMPYPEDYPGDSLVLIMSDNRDDFKSYIQNAIDKNPPEGRVQGFYDALQKNIIEAIVEPRDRILNHPELLKVAKEEAERRKEKNICFLKNCKLI